MSARILPKALAIAFLGASLSAGAATQIVQDPSFEMGDDAASPWTQFSSNFGTPLCTVALCGTGTGPHTGEWWAWFGGISAPETGLVSQPMTFAAGTAQMSFWFENITSGDVSDYIEARVDGTTVWSYNAGGAYNGILGYSEINVNLNAFADGGSHTLEFYSVSGTNGGSNFFVDDVTIMTAAVPEPGTYALMALGLAGLAAARRAKRSRS